MNEYDQGIFKGNTDMAYDEKYGVHGALNEPCDSMGRNCDAMGISSERRDATNVGYYDGNIDRGVCM